MFTFMKMYCRLCVAGCFLYIHFRYSQRTDHDGTIATSTADERGRVHVPRGTDGKRKSRGVDPQRRKPHCAGERRRRSWLLQPLPTPLPSLRQNPRRRRRSVLRGGRHPHLRMFNPHDDRLVHTQEQGRQQLYLISHLRCFLSHHIHHHSPLPSSSSSYSLLLLLL